MQNAARKGLDTTVSQMPELTGFHVIRVVYREFQSDESIDGMYCYYARAFFVVGSNWTADEAELKYTQQLQTLGLGWQPREFPNDGQVLYRGRNEDVVVSKNQPEVGVIEAEEYAQVQATYPGVFFITLEYILPSRDGC